MIIFILFFSKNLDIMSTLTLISDDLIDKIASFSIDDTYNLYDSRFGCAGSLEIECTTCSLRGEDCLGHFGSLSLKKKMFHPFIYKRAEYIINNTCWECCQTLPESVPKQKRMCCGIIWPGIFSIKAHELDGIYNELLDYKEKIPDNIEKKILPKGFVFSKILIPPINLRNTEEMEWSTDIQTHYEQLIYLIKNLDKNKKKMETEIENIKRKTNITKEPKRTNEQLINEVKRKADKKNPNAYYATMIQKNILPFLSGKQGIFRNFMLGKRVESCARAVIVGDPTLPLDTISVPQSIVNNIKKSIICNKYNKELIQKLSEQNNLWWPGTEDRVHFDNIVIGMMYEKKLQNGDFFLFNRQPTLSRYSMLAFKCKIRTDKYEVFGMNPQVTAPFNADFDGDEMNAFFFSDKSELTQISQTIVDCIVPIQDVVTGCYIMSSKDETVDESTWNYCMMLFPETPLNTVSKTTINILYICIPGYTGNVITKKILLKYMRSCKDTLDMMYKLQLIVLHWLSIRGLTISLKSLVANPLTIMADETSEIFQERCTTHVIQKLKHTDIMNIIQSGAKGSVIHATQIAVALGHQYIKGRPNIFCEHSFIDGLDPEEFFGHQMAGREGVVSTSVSTASTGYVNRKGCKILADLKVQYDSTVSDKNGISSFNVF